MKRDDDSPFYTRAKPIPGQEEIPVGTVHTCANCKSDYICDSKTCRIDRVTDGADSPCCSKTTPHSQDRRNRLCAHCGEWGCTIRHKVCAHCKGIDGHHYRYCRTQKGYQFSLI